jgi:hypothetical protein
MLGHMSLHVEGEMVGPGKGPFAHLALERLGTRVLPVVSGQLVRPTDRYVESESALGRKTERRKGKD